MKQPALDGLLVIDKPTGMMSRAVVNRAAGWFPRKTRIGHTGTLDPLASGVLVLCVGRATRLTEYVQRMAKVYRAGVTFGAVSDTDDADGTVTPAPVTHIPSREEVERALGSFVGAISQVPPRFSAAKVTGRRAYDLARKGKEVSLAPRTVVIHAIEILAYEYPRLEIEVRCGKGTYIRSLARDLGQRLGCGGYIASLRRLAVGCFRADQACPLDADPAEVRAGLLPLSSAVHDLPKLTLATSDATVLLHGRSVPAPREWEGKFTEAAVFDVSDRLLAVVDIADGMLRPNKALLRAEDLQ